jgi:hypothetical protein
VAHRGRGEADCAAQGGRRRGPGGARTKLGGVVEAGVVVGCSGPGDAPVVEAEPERSSAGAPVWRSGVAAVAQSRGTAEWAVRRQLGLGAAIARRGVGADDWGRFKGGRPGILGVRAQRDPGGDFGRGELRERRLRGGKGKDRQAGPGCSEGEARRGWALAGARRGDGPGRGGAKRAENWRARWARGEAGWASGANWAERGVWATGERLGFGLGLGLGFLSIFLSISLLFLIQTRFEFKYKFEFNHAQSIKSYAPA